MADDKEEWIEDRKYVLESLVTMSKNIKELYEKLTDARIAIGMLQVKAGLMGAVTGIIFGAIAGALVRMAF